MSSQSNRQQTNKQPSTVDSRGYHMRKRADNIDHTRQRIVEATVDLHGSIGPADTSVTAIAKKAGVTRLTVYRHFPDTDTLFTACTQHWMAAQALPDANAWARIDDPLQRVRTALADVYRFYAEGEPMLTRVHHDWDILPDPPRAALTRLATHHRDLLLAPFTTRASTGRRRLRAALAHALAFPTWQSLCREQGLRANEAIDLLTAMVATANR
jgi:AcrR family transcriptional regulator